MRKLILRNFQSAGDIVMLTAAVRDLHRSYPGEFLTDVRTPFPDLWAFNPHITALHEDAPDVEIVDCHYPLIDQCNETPCHFLHGFPAYLNDTLGLRIRVTEFKCDIHLGELEREWFRHVTHLQPEVGPFWLMVSGGKRDLPSNGGILLAISRSLIVQQPLEQFVVAGARPCRLKDQRLRHSSRRSNQSGCVPTRADSSIVTKPFTETDQCRLVNDERSRLR